MKHPSLAGIVTGLERLQPDDARAKLTEFLAEAAADGIAYQERRRRLDVNAHLCTRLREAGVSERIWGAT